MDSGLKRCGLSTEWAVFMDSGSKRCGLSTEWAFFMDRRANNKIFCDELLSLFIKFLKRCTSACKYASKRLKAVDAAQPWAALTALCLSRPEIVRY